MDNEEIFLVWAPPQVPWSDWVKPVAFAQGSPSSLLAAADSLLQGWQSLPIEWLPAPNDTAVIIDLAGPISVAYGLALAKRGYRPVPMYNACTGTSEIVNMQQIVRALFEGVRELAAMNFSQQAPPAFLLDSERLQGGSSLQPGRFDNRWMVFPQDFPSANFVQSQQIRRVLVIRTGSPSVPDDLAHVLLRWQEAKVELLHQDPVNTGPPQPLQVHRPKHFKSIWYRLLAMTGMRRNSAGGFGSIIPQPSSGMG